MKARKKTTQVVKELFGGALVVIVGLVFILMFIYIVNFFNPISAEVLKYERYIVQANDSLWNIAEKITPIEVDIRDTIRLIKKENDLIDSTIKVGQPLWIPVYGER